MYTREQTCAIKVGNLTIGHNNKVIIQSMTTAKTHDIKSTLSQIDDLASAGCELVRVAVLGMDDALALKTIVAHSTIPVVADIHFNYKFALIAAKAGVAKIRINPGNIGSIENTRAVVDACKIQDIPIRIGVNSGSLPRDLVNQFGWTAQCMVEAAAQHIAILEQLNFKKIILSLKATSPMMAIDAYRQAAERWNYPLHLGITEAGSTLNGAIKSSVGLGVLLAQGIGNTIRISLSTDPINEIKVAKKILNSVNLYDNIVDVIACPTCGRLEYNLFPLVKQIEDYTADMNFPYSIAILGCAVNGPGEASQADLGVAGGKDGGIIFKKGKIIKTCHQDDLFTNLKQIIDEAYNTWKKGK